MLRDLIDDFVNAEPEGDRQGLLKELEDLQQLLKFGIEAAEVTKAAKCLARLQPKYDSTNPAFKRLTSFATHLGSNYLPFVATPKECAPEYIEVRYGVDLNVPFAERTHGRRVYHHPARHRFWDWFRFVAIGSTPFEMQVPIDAVADPPWSATDSLHLQLNLPYGVSVTERPEALPAWLFEGSAIDRFTSVSADYVYSYLTADGAKAVRTRLEGLSRRRDGAKAKIDRTVKENADFSKRRREAHRAQKSAASDAPEKPPHGPIEMSRNLLYFVRLNREWKDASRPRIRAEASVDNGVRLLGLFLWFVVALTYGVQLLGLLTEAAYLDLFAAFLLVILTLAVYSLDKPFVRYPVFSHVAATTVVFFELPLLAEYGARLSALFHVG
jgi:hypothetical protein